MNERRFQFHNSFRQLFFFQVFQYSNEGFFGELALMYNTPRYLAHNRGIVTCFELVQRIRMAHNRGIVMCFEVVQHSFFFFYFKQLIMIIVFCSVCFSERLQCKLLLLAFCGDLIAEPSRGLSVKLRAERWLRESFSQWFKHVMGISDVGCMHAHVVTHFNYC